MHQDAEGAYSTPQDPLAGLRGEGVGKGKGRKERRGGRKGEDPQCLKCVDASGWWFYI